MDDFTCFSTASHIVSKASCSLLGRPLWAPNVLWKLIDFAVGAIQAFIFALLTILYFGFALEPEDEEAPAH
jgi:F0F1-type ATP synthase membrane subunit a